MARSRNNVSKLVQHVSGSRQGGSLPENLLHSTQGSSGSTAGRPGAIDGAHASLLGSSDHLKAIQFGGPSSSGLRASSTSSSGDLQSLLRQGASAGLGGLLENSLSNLGGIGSLVTAFFHMFGGGGKSAPPPLVRFQLPSAQEQTAYVSSSGKSVYAGKVVENGNSQSGSGGQGSSGRVSAGQSQQYQSGEIAQAVKTALLTSSTLNDVISEI